MASSTLSPGTGTNDAAAGDVAWSNPGNIVSSNNTRATCGLASGTITDHTINLVRPDGTWGAGDNKADATAWTSTDATTAYGTSSNLWGQAWTEADVEDTDFGAVVRAQSSGGNTSQWLRASAFGFAITSGSTIDGIVVNVEKSIAIGRSSVTVRVDHVAITVHFTEPPSTWIPKTILYALALLSPALSLSLAYATSRCVQRTQTRSTRIFEPCLT